MAYRSCMPQSAQRAPRTASELERLRAQRQEITSQLDEVTARRGRLGQERLNAQARGDLEIVKEYDGTIKQLGERMNQLNGQLISADKAIAEAVANGVGQTREPVETRTITLPNGQTFGIGTTVGTPVVPGSLVSQRDMMLQRQFYQQMMIAEAAGFLLLGTIVGWFLWKRAGRSAGAVSGGEIAGLRTSVDAIAIEVERISENQRYVTKLITEGAANPLVKQGVEPMRRDISR